MKITERAIEARRAMVANASNITLDGLPATIRGFSLPFAYVYRADGKGGDVEFSWMAVESVLRKGGAFKS